MRYAVKTQPEETISLPETLHAALGRPDEVEVEQTEGGLVVRATEAPRDRSIAARLAAIDAYRARWAEQPGGGFAPGELERLLEEAREHERRKSNGFLGEDWLDG